VLQALVSALVLDRVVQQCRYRLVLVTAVFQHQRGHGKQMRNVGDVGPLAHLLRMRLTRIHQCAIESRGQKAAEPFLHSWSSEYFNNDSDRLSRTAATRS